MKVLILFLGMACLSIIPFESYAQVGQDDLIMALTGGDSSANNYGNRSMQFVESRVATEVEKGNSSLEISVPNLSGTWQFGVATPTGQHIIMSQVSSNSISVAINSAEKGEYTYFFVDGQSIYYGKVILK